MNLATSCALVSYSSSITGLRSTALPIACSICFDTSLSPFPCWFQWLPPPIAILQDLMSDPSHSFSLSTSLLILHTLPDDVQPTDFLLLLDTELEGHFSPSASLMRPITQLQSLSPSQLFFFPVPFTLNT